MWKTEVWRTYWRTDLLTDWRTDSEQTKFPRQAGRGLIKRSCFDFVFPICRDLIQSYDKIPYANWNIKKSKVTTQKTPPKCSITQQLRTDLELPVWVSTATKLLWLTSLRSQSSHHSTQQPCNQKDETFPNFHFQGCEGKDEREGEQRHL